MTIIEGVTPAELDAIADAFAEEVKDAVYDAFNATFTSAMDIVTAATEPSTKNETDEARRLFTSTAVGYFVYHWSQRVTSTIIPRFTTIINESIETIASAIQSWWTVLDPVRIDPNEDQGLKRYVNDVSRRMSTLGPDTRDRIQATVREGIQMNRTVSEIRDGIMDVADVTASRAMTIARTEVVSAYNFAALSEMLTLGAVGTKTWLAKIDTRTRHTHRDADGQKVNITKSFRVGGSRLLFPGDPTGPPGEVINCRCSLSFDIQHFSALQRFIRAR